MNISKHVRIDHPSTRRAFANVASSFRNATPDVCTSVHIPSCRTLRHTAPTRDKKTAIQQEI